MKNLIFLTAVASLLLLGGCKSEEIQVMETQQAIKVSNQDIAERQQQQEIAKAKAEAELSYNESIKPIWVFGTAILIIGIAGCIVLFSAQAAFYGGQWIKTRSQLAYAGSDGQMPLIITRGNGYQIISDPNLQIADSNIIRLPTPREQVAGLLQGRNTEIKQLTTAESYNPMQLKAATQAQSVRLMRAAVSGSDMDRIERRQARKLAEDKVSNDLKNPMDEPITAEIRIPRSFELVDKTGNTTL